MDQETIKNAQVFIFGYYGWKNSGDDAMVYALLEHLCGIWGKTTFAVLSQVPIILPPQAMGRVKFVPLSLLAVLQEIRQSSAFIIGGGTHMFDYGLKRRAVQILLRLLCLVLFAKALRKRVYFVGIGLGSFTTAWGGALAKLICHLADFISVRDRESYRILERWGLTTHALLSFDLSALVECSPLVQEETVGVQRKILGVSVSPAFQIYYDDKDGDILVVEGISMAINKWLRQSVSHKVRVFTFKGESKDDDVLITRLLQEKLHPQKQVEVIPYNPNPSKLLAQIAQCYAFVGMRYHSCLFAYLVSIPLLIIAYHPKCRALADEIGLPQQTVLSLFEILEGRFSENLDNLLHSPLLATFPMAEARRRALEGIKGVRI